MKGFLSAFFLILQWLVAFPLLAAPIPDAPPLPGEVKGGRLSVVSINVAEQGGRVQEQQRLAKTGLLLQNFNIVLVQKNFWYKQLLEESYAGEQQASDIAAGSVKKPPRSTRISSSNMGLSTLTGYTSTVLEPVRWPKREFSPAPDREGNPSSDSIRVHGGQPVGGATVTTVKLTGENKLSVELDVYNVDLSGEFKGSIVSDTNQRIALLFERIQSRDKSGRRPFIIAGNYNFNLLGDYREEFESTLIQRFHSELGVDQPFSVLHGFVGFHKGRWMFYRSGDKVRLEPLEAYLLAKQFRSEDRRPLTLEPPAGVTFNWFFKNETNEGSESTSEKDSDANKESPQPGQDKSTDKEENLNDDTSGGSKNPENQDSNDDEKAEQDRLPNENDKGPQQDEPTDDSNDAGRENEEEAANDDVAPDNDESDVTEDGKEPDATQDNSDQNVTGGDSGSKDPEEYEDDLVVEDEPDDELVFEEDPEDLIEFIEPELPPEGDDSETITEGDQSFEITPTTIKEAFDRFNLQNLPTLEQTPNPSPASRVEDDVTDTNQ